MHIEVVNAVKKDLERLIEVYSSLNLYHNREDATWFVKSFFDYHHVKVVRLDGNIVGALFWRVNEERHHGIIVIEDFWIDEKFRRRGLGEKLLKTVIEDAKTFFEKSGYALRRVLVTTAETNIPARRLYEKIGFQKCAELEDLFGQGETELIYVLTLKP
jgi:ribosomal protein S18 acetylase RimI-like enzyme